MTKPIIIRNMTRAELDLAVEWAAQEGWNPGWHDAGCFWAADPHGFFVGLLGDEPVATISAVKYDDTFGFIGFFIVKANYRSQGFGNLLGRTALEYLRQANVGLDGVVAQQDYYQRHGFRIAYRNIRYRFISIGQEFSKPQIVELGRVPFEMLTAYDRQMFPAPRTEFLKLWISQPGTVALGFSGDKLLQGYGVRRTCREGFKIGPLFADHAETADLLFQALTAGLKSGQPVFIDVPEVNPAARDLILKYKMTKVFETTRMYSAKPPDINLGKIFGVTSFELG